MNRIERIAVGLGILFVVGAIVVFGPRLWAETAARESADDPATPDDAPSNVEYLSSTSATIGDVLVEIGQPLVSTVELESSLAGTVYESDDEMLQVSVRVSVAEESNTLFEYGSWRGRDTIWVADEFGNRYDGMDRKPVGGIHYRELYPGDQVVDLLLFQRPVPNAKSLTLHISQHVVEASHPLEFELDL